ncbi:MAG: T9SS type A sorting domain-containing protein [Bacteroidales bacterium]
MVRIIFFFILISNIISAQINHDAKRDYTWVFGSNYNDFNTEYTIDFDSGFFATHLFHHDIHLWANNASISDTAGHILFFSNGQQIVNKNGDIMDNGDAIVTSGYYNYWLQYNTEPSLPQSIIILPNPNYPDFYMVFHSRYDLSEDPTAIQPLCTGLHYSIVDMSQNNELGKVTEKGQLLINDTLAQGGITAVRNGNGRDWWVLVPSKNSQKYYTILLNPGGIHIDSILLSDNYFPIDYEVMSCFSPDGEKFIRHYPSHDGPAFDSTINVEIYNFNRCTGSLVLSAFFQLYSDHGFYGISISQNSKYLYLSDALTCYQFDLQSQNIQNSKVIVAQYDGFDPQGYPTVFTFHKLGPDNKIYVGAGHSKYLHVIENPDLHGDSCSFIQREIQLPCLSLYGPMPNIPNFRLGRLEGAECDTLYNTINEYNFSQKNQFRIFPNPGKELCTIEISNPEYSEFTFILKDIFGHEVLKKNINLSNRLHNIDISKLKTGTYIIIISNDFKIIFRKKYLIINN